VMCRTYTDDELQSMHFSGVATWGGGKSPFMFLTLNRQDGPAETSETFLVVVRDDMIHIVDCSRGGYYVENLANRGASLLSAKLNIVFILFSEPQILDLFKSMPATVMKSASPSGDALRLAADDNLCHLDLTVDASTYMPLRVERTVKNRDGSLVRTVLEISNITISKAKLPDTVFDINGAFGFPVSRFDPTGLVAQKAAPAFEISTLDGGKFTLAEHRGKWVFLCFRASSDRLRGESESCFDRAGDLVRGRGGFFIDVISTDYRNLDQNGVESLSNTCRSDVLARIYSVRRVGFPCIVAISPEGVVNDVFIGYIPTVTERALGEYIERILPAASGK